MPLLRNVEEYILRVERFGVHFCRNGRKINRNKQNVPQYRRLNASRGSWTVSEWKNKVFNQQYPGYYAKVLDGNGDEASGSMTLDNVRDTY